MTNLQARQLFTNAANMFVGTLEGDERHHRIVDIYNSHHPLARGYRLRYTDSWCAGFVSAIAIMTEMTDIIPTEVSCNQMISLFQKMKRWVEDDSYVPDSGDIIFYDWDDGGTGDNRNGSDHVGIVIRASARNIQAVEGNYRNCVAYRTIPVNGKYIRGFGIPDFSKKSDIKDYYTIAEEVIAGRWNVGAQRQKQLTEAGYDYFAVQSQVNEILNSGRKSSYEIASEVIAGKWDNGEKRKIKLTEAGYDYGRIQQTVNDILKGVYVNER